MVEKRRRNWRKWGKSIRKIIIMTGYFTVKFRFRRIFFIEKRLGLKAGCPKIKTTVNIEK